MAAGRFSAWWAWRPWAALGCAVAGWVCPGLGHAAFADVTVHFIGEPVQSRSDGFGGGAPSAQVVFSGGGDLVPWREGHGDFLLAASASNARGALHAAVDVGTVGCGRAAGVASASVVDSLMIGGTRAVDLELRLAVQGSFTASGRNAFFRTSSGLSAGSFSSAVTTSWIAGSTVANQSPTVSVSPGTGDVQVISREPGNVILWHTVRQTVLPGTVLEVSAFLTVSGDVGEDSRAQADFGHTAQLWLGLPAGTPFTSRSGVFLTEAPSLPVPEPGTWALWLAGLMGCVLAGRKRPGQRPGIAVTVLSGMLFAGSIQAEVSVTANIGNTGDVARIEQRSLPRSALLLAEHCGQRYQVLTDCTGGLGDAGSDWVGTRLARADDQSGVLGVRVHMAYADGLLWLHPSARPVGGQATASLEGELLVTGSQGGTLALQMNLDGYFDGSGSARAGANASLVVSVLRAATGRRDVDDLASIQLHWQPGETDAALDWPASGDVQIIDLDHRDVRAVLQTQVPLAPGDIVRVQGFLSTSATGYLPGTSILSDFGNTAQLSLLASPGLQLSPVEAGFLQLAPVPEPGIWSLLAAGLLLVLPCVRVRRQLASTGAAAVVLPALLLLVAPPASAQLASVAVWNSGNFSNPNPAANLRSQEVTSGRAEASHSATTSPFSDRVDWVAGASADLRRGSVGVEIQADRIGNPVGTQGDTVWAHAELNETLTFTGTRAGVVDFAAGISGSFQSVDGSAFQAEGFLFAGGLSGQLDFHWVNNLSSPTVSVFASPGTTGIRSDPAGLFGTIHLLRLVQPGETLALQLRMDLRVGPGAHDHAVANFGHTAQLGIVLPDGLSFASASGHFMAEAPPLPVPEPAGAWLLLAGLPLLRAAQRR